MVKPYYEEPGITIYNCDCREIIHSIKADLLLTDPPYGIGEAAGKNKSRGKKVGFKGSKSNAVAYVRDYGDEDWDDAPPSNWIFECLRENNKHQIIFGGNYFNMPPSRCWLVWDKNNYGTDFADCELAWTNLDKAVRLFKWTWNGMLQEDMANKEERVHPTQKPLSLLKWCIKQAPSDIKTVFDPFSGSFTTAVACKQFGIDFIGIEQSEKYCEAGVQRLRQEVFSFG
jgi:site-specific DNA-methyltransferase (adenine-specific)